MFQLQNPELLLLAVAVVLAFARWTSFRPQWSWLAVAGAICIAIPFLPANWPIWAGPAATAAALAVALPGLWPWFRTAGPTGVIRFCLVSLLILILAGPRWNWGGRGIDVIVLADRSLSMNEAAANSVRENIASLESSRGPEDRISVIAFADVARLEYGLSQTNNLSNYTQEVDPNSTNLSDALFTALNLADKRRPTAILILSDGEETGAIPLEAARRARDQRIRVDFRAYERPRTGDCAVSKLSPPQVVMPREPFQFTAEIAARQTVMARYLLRRGNFVVTRGRQEFRPGVTVLTFRDILSEPGITEYELELILPDDPLPENNRASAVTRVLSPPRVLVLNATGTKDKFATTLEGIGLDVTVSAASQHPVTLDSLDAYRTIVLEDVPASDLGRQKLERLAQYVEDLGGGLMMTGGQNSFGAGGYLESPLDPVLPVSMEIRDEHRRDQLALVIALDRSGSMAVPVNNNLTKMDLANKGAIASIRLLSRRDRVCVMEVDTSAHITQPLTTIENRDAIIRRVEKIRSQGGGIYVYEALQAAWKQLESARNARRHILLFSDAGDSEAPGDYQRLLAQIVEQGGTVSVIGLGRPTDVHAGLLKDIARRGRGNIMFTTDPRELPRLFSQDTLAAATSTFVRKDEDTQPDGIPGALLPSSRLIGRLPGIDLTKNEDAPFPNSDGFNLTYLRPEATLGVVSRDAYKAPWSAFWYRGLGRVVAMPIQVDGEFTGKFGSWSQYSSFIVTHIRWLLGGSEIGQIYSEFQTSGQDALVRIELDDSRPDAPTLLPLLEVIPPGADRQTVLRPDLLWTGPSTLEGRFRMQRTGTWHSLIRLGEREFQRGPAITLPYSPEFALRVDQPPGREVLQQIADLTGGISRSDITRIFSDPPPFRHYTSLLPVIFVLILLLLLAEVIGRRLALWNPPQAVATARESARTEVPVPPPVSGETLVETPGPEPAEAPPVTTGQPESFDVYTAAKHRARRQIRS